MLCSECIVLEKKGCGCNAVLAEGGEAVSVYCVSEIGGGRGCAQY